MPSVDQPITLVVLGATGRVATMLRRVWAIKPPENMKVCWVARREAPGVDVIWNESGPVDSLPQCNAVLALWGPVSGDRQTLIDNSRLAAEAHRIARECGAERVLHASSAAVYEPSNQALNEASPCRPRNAYGRAKLEMEQAVSGETPAPVILRIGNVAGADGLFTSLGNGGDITLDRFSDGTGPVRSYIAPSTLARIVERLCAIPVGNLPEVLNVGGVTPVSMAAIVVAAGHSLQWRAAPDDALPVMALDVSRLKEIVDLDGTSSDPKSLVEEWLSYGVPA